MITAGRFGIGDHFSVEVAVIGEAVKIRGIFFLIVPMGFHFQQSLFFCYQKEAPVVESFFQDAVWGE